MSAGEPLVHGDGRVAGGVIVWRHRARTMLTVVAKASFSLTHGAAPSHLGPSPIVREDRTRGGHPSRSLEVASDLALYKARCDVTLMGHACSPQGRMVTAMRARLALGQSGRTLLDKSVHVSGRPTPGGDPEPFARTPLVYESARGGPGEENPVGVASPTLADVADPTRPAGLGPISPFWPSRKRLLRGIERRALDGGAAPLPDVVPWDFFQSAPPDQQIEHLQGGEWLVLEGFDPMMSRIEARLPVARAVAALVIASHRGEELRSTPLACDTLHLTPDARTMTLTWRGCVDVTELSLGALTVLTALPAPGEPVDFLQLRVAALGVSPTAPADSGANRDPVGEGTVAMSHDIEARPALPFSAPREAVGESTIGMTPAQHEVVGRRISAPFAIAQPGPPRVSSTRTPGLPWSPEAMPAAPRAIPGEETLAVGQPARSAARPAPPNALAEKLLDAGAKADELAMLLAAIAPPEPGSDQ